MARYLLQCASLTLKLATVNVVIDTNNGLINTVRNVQDVYFQGTIGVQNQGLGI